METITTQAPAAGKPQSADTDVRVGPNMRASNALTVKPRADASKAESKSAKGVKATAKGKAKAESKKRKAGLFFFQQTPAGKMLRAYFLAFIMHQTGGKLTVGSTFKLWPGANIRGHLDTRKVTRTEGGYSLSTQGYNYFSDPLQMADKDMLATMSKAIRTGEKPDVYRFEMSAVQS